MAQTKKFLTEGPKVEFKTADKYVPDPKGLPRNKVHAKNYKPDCTPPKR